MNGTRAVITGEQALAFENFDLPDELSENQVLVKTERTVVSAGTELANYAAVDPNVYVPGSWCCYPWAPGYGGVGRVVAKGSAVSRLSVGDRVYGFFHHATHEVVDSVEEVLIPVPEGLDPTSAAMARMCSIAITAFRRSHLALGDTVAVIGLGLVGNIAGQYFHAAGQRVVGIDLVSHRRELAKKVGFEQTVDPTGLSPVEMREKITELTGSAPKVVVEAVGNSHLVDFAVRMVANNGQVSLLGSPRTPWVTDITEHFKEVHARGVEVVGALEWTFPTLKRTAPGISIEGNTELIFQLILNDSLNMGLLLSHVLPPAELNNAYQGLLHDKDAYLGVVLDWEHNPVPAVG